MEQPLIPAQEVETDVLLLHFLQDTNSTLLSGSAGT